MINLVRFYLYKYRINLMARERLCLPVYKGSTIRGTFGHAFKRVVCATKGVRCDGCMLKQKCIYSKIMETPMPEGHSDERKYRNAPHPYIISPPLDMRQHFKAGDMLSADLVLIGHVNDYLPYIIYTFTEMGKIGIGRGRGRFDIASVDALYLDGHCEEIFNSTDNIMKDPNNKITFEQLSVYEGPVDDEITISFETPVRIKQCNRLAPTIPFNLLIERLYERAGLLAHLYCGAELCYPDESLKSAETIEITGNNLKWLDWERYSNRQQTRMSFGGWIGEITYKGTIRPFIPLLRLGEYIHVGKAVTFGLGKYRIIIPS